MGVGALAEAKEGVEVVGMVKGRLAMEVGVEEAEAPWAARVVKEVVVIEGVGEEVSAEVERAAASREVREELTGGVWEVALAAAKGEEVLGRSAMLVYAPSAASRIGWSQAAADHYVRTVGERPPPEPLQSESSKPR